MGVFDVSLGPLLLGTILNVLLLGMMLMQVYLYFTRFWGKDRKWINYMVLFLLVTDVVNSALDVTFVYQYTITNFGNLKAIQTSNWVFNSDPAMTVILSSVCQTFFAWRVRLLTKKRWLFILLLLSIVIQLLMGIATSIACTIVKVFVEFQRFRVIVMIWLVLSSVTDGVIAATLVWYLRSHRSGYAETNTVLTRLTRITVETGLITAVWATIDLIVYLTFPNSLHLIFNLPLGKLYTNSLLSTLNSRVNWAQEPGVPSESGSIPMGIQKLDPSKTNPSGSTKVMWASGGKSSAVDRIGNNRPASIVRTQRENGILVTSSTIIHHDDEYDLTDAKPLADGLGPAGHVALVQPASGDDKDVN